MFLCIFNPQNHGILNTRNGLRLFAPRSRKNGSSAVCELGKLWLSSLVLFALATKDLYRK